MCQVRREKREEEREPRRRAGLGEALREFERRDRREFRRLQHDGVAAGDRHTVEP